ncbi:MAG: cytochrome P450 [Boseongicola sp.]|nr:cytochrome P450 [Boseongicola sp.]
MSPHPDVTKFDLLNVPSAYFADQYRHFAALRECSPIHCNSGGTFIVARCDHCAAAYRDPVTWSSGKRADFARKFGNAATLYEQHSTSVVFTVAPNHTRIRKLFRRALTRRALAAFEPRIANFVDTCLDHLEATGEMDMVEEISFKLPIEVVRDLLGGPGCDRDMIRGRTLAILTALEPMLTAEQHADGNRAVIEFKQYLRDLIRRRRSFPDEASPTEVLTVRADAVADGVRLTELELLHQCIFMLNAGHESSTKALSHGVHEMLRSHGEVRRLAENQGSVDTIVDEVLRYQAPNQNNNRRSTKDTEIGGLPMPAGTTVHVIVSAANRDPRQFPDPDRLDMARAANRRLSFGPGVCNCAGISLARMEAAIALRKPFGRFPELQLMAPPEIATRLRFREIRHLHIAVN